MPPPPLIPCWPPLSRLELVRRSEEAPPGCPGPIGFGGPDDTISAGDGRAPKSAETNPRSSAPPATQHAILSARHRPQDPPKLRRNEAANPPRPASQPAKSSRPRIRRSGGRSRAESRPSRTRSPPPRTAARRRSSTATAAAAPDKLGSG